MSLISWSKNDVGAFNARFLQHHTGRQIDALELQAQRAPRAAVEHSLHELSGSRVARRSLHHRVFFALATQRPRELVESCCTENMESRDPRQVRREHLGYRRRDAARIRSGVVSDRANGDDRNART